MWIMFWTVLWISVVVLIIRWFWAANSVDFTDDDNAYYEN